MPLLDRFLFYAKNRPDVWFARTDEIAKHGRHTFSADDGNGPMESPVGTWSNGSELAQGLLAPATTTTEIQVACTDFKVDATGRPIYCLVGSSSIQIIP